MAWFVDTNPDNNMRADQWISFSCNFFFIFFLNVVFRAKTAMEVNNKKRKPRFLITYFSQVLSKKGYIKDDISGISWKSRFHHQQSFL